MGIDIQISCGIDIQIKKAVYGQKCQHMIQKAYSRVYGGSSLAVYSKTQIYVSFFCSSIDLCFS